MHSLRKKLRKPCHSEEAQADEESTHYVDIYGQIGAKVLRRASLAQDDRIVQWMTGLLRMTGLWEIMP